MPVGSESESAFLANASERPGPRLHYRLLTLCPASSLRGAGASHQHVACAGAPARGVHRWPHRVRVLQNHRRLGPGGAPPRPPRRRGGGLGPWPGLAAWPGPA